MKSNMNGEFVKMIVECIDNALIGNIPLDKHAVKFLNKYKSKLLSISRGHISLNKRKKLIQRGGILPLIIQVIGSAIVGHLLSKI